MTARTHLFALALAAVPLFPLHAAEPEAGGDYGLVSALPPEGTPDPAAEQPAPPEPAAEAPAAEPAEPLPPPPAAPEAGASEPEAAADPAVAVAAEAPQPVYVPQPEVVPNPAITATDPETEAKLANVRVVTVRNIDWRELSPGMPIYAQGGVLIGKVINVMGTDVIVDSGQGQLRVPLVALYSYNVGGADYIASRLTRADLQKGG
ncbi:hypothetical protein [Novosphingobium colocasiae]|uniref:PRC-barrel domain-containing protein n=1 Tax=Novosphingobium colocasiae TaxID=1256513 RepID=A0A918P8W3_9SPHN|nr:hypothetical protein [Novosphingobium colocasiae]GGY91451.1 hypothetical protein GCM10011614_02670 [Novosphingobium colocasiae]